MDEAEKIVSEVQDHYAEYGADEYPIWLAGRIRSYGEQCRRAAEAASPDHKERLIKRTGWANFYPLDKIGATTIIFNTEAEAKEAVQGLAPPMFVEIRPISERADDVPPPAKKCLTPAPGRYKMAESKERKRDYSYSKGQSFLRKTKTGYDI